MSSEKTDLLGLAPYGDALHTLTKGVVDGAAAFLGRICLPATEEFGLFLRDKVHAWRARNTVEVVQAAEKKMGVAVLTSLHAHPRIVHEIVDQGSWTDDAQVQQMWGGLLASSCTPDGRDEENYLFVTLLRQLSSSEAKVLSFACANAPKSATLNGLIQSRGFHPSVADVLSASGVSDIHRVDRELDHLRALDLIDGGFDTSQTTSPADLIQLTPTPLGLNLYVRCQGSRRSPVEYFGTKLAEQ